MSKNFSLVWKENGERRNKLLSYYDPIQGVGSPIPRFRLNITKGDYLLLPEEMQELPTIKDALAYPCVADYLASIGQGSINTLASFLIELDKVRLSYDFEYWCAKCVKVQDKETKKDIPFILRRPQRRLFERIWSQWRAGVPVRIIVVKARQWGGSTLIQMFMAWVQLTQETGWHSVIVGDVEGQARNVRGMYTRLAGSYPPDLATVTFAPFEGSNKNKIIKERGCIVSIGSMQKPDNLRSFDIMMAHLSEVGLWKETLGKKPEDLAQSISGTVPLIPRTIVVMESTAKGVGNYFHRLYQKASIDDTGMIALFIPWWDIEMYQLEFKDRFEAEKFWDSMTDYERLLWDLGATLEGIKWYRWKKSTDDLDDWRMGAEFPSFVDEAFQSTGKRAYSPLFTKRMRKFCKDPIFIGDVFADASRGNDALKNIHVAPVPKGNLWLWKLPEMGEQMEGRYVVSVDIGGVNPNADYSIIRIIDRFWLTDGGVPEAVGTWRGHIDQDLLIWKAVMLCKLFGDATLAVESNSLDKQADTEGSHFITVLDEIKDFYDNIFARTDPQKIREGAPAQYGFHTNKATKTDLINTMRRIYRTIGYIERDARAMDEADTYEMKDNGSFGAVDGAHDDIHMSTAIGLKVSEKMDLPKLRTMYVASTETRITNEYTF